MIVGAAGRDHALAWKLSQASRIGEIFVAPGNGGTALIATNVAIAVDAFDELIAFAKANAVDIVYVSGDDELGAGLVDMCNAAGLKAFGPTKAAARIESSKAFSKDFMISHDIPTAAYKTFKDYDAAKTYIQTQPLPVVIKASGLAAGKGAIICRTLDEAETSLYEIMVDKMFGSAGDKVVIEEFMEGPEISIHVFSDGSTYKLFPPAQDHKAIYEGNSGPNTGGMGTLAPLPYVSDELMNEIDRKIVAPVISGMREMGCEFKGVLYPGIMLTSEGPKVLEYNARFGDPETQSYLRLLETDLLEILEACIDGTLDKVNLKWSDKTAVNIVLASAGYPEAYEKGKEIIGITEAENNDDIVVFQAGTTLKDNALLTNGGRVLGVSAVGDNLDDALAKAYSAAEHIQFEGKTLRTDIGKAHNNARLRDF